MFQTAFQQNAFQNDAFQIVIKPLGGEDATPILPYSVQPSPFPQRVWAIVNPPVSPQNTPLPWV